MVSVTSDGRLTWVVEQLDLEPTHDVVEIGCGHGVAASLVLEQLTTGQYVGVDRSEKMVEAAERRNGDAVREGRARFVCSTVVDLQVGPSRFDRVFAARVAAMANQAELAAVARATQPGGLIVVSFESPAEDTTRQLIGRTEACALTVGLELLPASEVMIDGTLVVCVRLRS